MRLVCLAFSAQYTHHRLMDLQLASIPNSQDLHWSPKEVKEIPFYALQTLTSTIFPFDFHAGLEEIRLGSSSNNSLVKNKCGLQDIVSILRVTLI